VNEVGGGTVKYLADGADFVVRSRREDAYKKMYEDCHGRYSIVDETIEKEGGAAAVAPSYNGGATAFAAPFTYVYITYECVE
jgi:hypothetical protein